MRTSISGKKKTKKCHYKSNPQCRAWFQASVAKWILIPVPSSKVKGSWPLKMGWIGCPETSVRNYHYSLRNNLEDRSYPQCLVDYIQKIKISSSPSLPVCGLLQIPLALFERKFL